MSDTQRDLMAVNLAKGGLVAANVFYDALKATDPAQRKQALLAIKSMPERALAVLQDFEANGFTRRGASDSLDLIVEEVPDAVEMLSKHVTPARLAELLAGRSDLPSSAILEVPADAVLAAIQEDVGDGGQEFLIAGILAWVKKIMDRDDYLDLLDARIGGRTLHDYLLLALWYEEKCPKDISDITPDVFEDYGIDFGEAGAWLEKAVEDGLYLSVDDFQMAKRKVAEMRKRVKAAPVLSAEKAAEDLDLG